MEQRLMVMVACGSAAEGRRIARELVEKRLAACVQMVPEVESVFRWKGKVETAAEVLLLIKINERHWDEMVAAVGAAHSYEVPEIVAVPLAAGLPAYFAWMDGELGS